MMNNYKTKEHYSGWLHAGFASIQTIALAIALAFASWGQLAHAQPSLQLHEVCLNNGSWQGAAVTTVGTVNANEFFWFDVRVKNVGTAGTGNGDLNIWVLTPNSFSSTYKGSFTEIVSYNVGASKFHKDDVGTPTAVVQHVNAQAEAANWSANQERDAGVKILAPSTGSVEIRVRTAYADANWENRIVYPNWDTGYVDCQGFYVWRYVVNVAPPTATIRARLEGIEGGYRPPRPSVRIKIGNHEDTGNPVEITQVPLNQSVRVIGSQQTTDADSVNPWQERERWIDRNDRFTEATQSRTYTRNLPYAETGVTWENGVSETFVGTAMTPRVRVRNATGVSRTVIVYVRLSPNKNFNNPAYSAQSTSVSIKANSELDVVLPAFTPAAAGEYYGAYRVRTKLTDGTQTTDTGGWSPTPVLTVNQATGTVTATLEGIEGGYEPPEGSVEFSISNRGGNGNPSTITQVPLHEGLRVIGSQKTDDSNNPWTERERWIDRNDTFTEATQSRTYTRNLPYAETGVTWENGVSETFVGTAMTPRVRVRNATGVSRTVIVYVRLSPNKNFNNPAYSAQSTGVSIKANSELDVDLPAFTPAAAGEYYGAYRVSTKLTDGTQTTDTGGWSPTPVLTVNQATGTVTATLEGIEGGYEPPEGSVEFLIGNRDGNGNPSTITQVPLHEGLRVIGSQKTDDSSNPWPERERWIDRIDTFTQASQSPTYTRNLPYSDTGIIWASGQSETVAGTRMTPRVAVRNNTDAARTVIVDVRLSPDKNFDSPTYSESASLLIPAKSVRDVDLPAFTPATEGNVFGVYRVQTQGLTDGTQTTDTGGWGIHAVLTVHPATVNATLAGIEGGYQPTNVMFAIGVTEGSGNPATLPVASLNVPLQMTGSQKPNDPRNPWQERERWVDQEDTFTRSSQPRIYRRNLPYAEAGIEWANGRWAAEVGSVMTPQVRVRNATDTSRTVTVEVRLSRTRDFNNLVYSELISDQTIPANSARDVDLPAFTPAAAENVFGVYRVQTQGLTDGTQTTDTGPWGELPVLRVVEEGHLIDFIPVTIPEEPDGWFWVSDGEALTQRFSILGEALGTGLSRPLLEQRVWSGGSLTLKSLNAATAKAIGGGASVGNSEDGRLRVRFTVPESGLYRMNAALSSTQYVLSLGYGLAQLSRPSYLFTQQFAIWDEVQPGALHHDWRLYASEHIAEDWRESVPEAVLMVAVEGLGGLFIAKKLHNMAAAIMAASLLHDGGSVLYELSAYASDVDRNRTFSRSAVLALEAGKTYIIELRTDSWVFAQGFGLGVQQYTQFASSLTLDSFSLTPIAEPLGPISPVMDVPRSLDFGEVPIGSTDNKTVRIDNNGDSDLVVHSIDVSGSFARISGGCGTIPLGGHSLIDIAFSPTDSGPVTGNLTIQSNMDEDGPRRVVLMGYGLPQPPSITTLEVSDITPRGARVHGRIEETGGQFVRTVGVAYSPNPNPCVASDHFEIVFPDDGIREFYLDLEGLLNQETPYYVRAFGINDAGIAYGGQVTFTTEPEIVPVPSLFILTPDGDVPLPYSQLDCDFSGTAEVENGQIAAVLFKINASPWRTTTGTENWSFNATGLMPGQNQVLVKAEDAQGNASEIITRTVTRSEALMTLEPESRHHGTDAIAGQEIAVFANIAWSAASDAAWLTITDGHAGDHNGLVRYTVEPNDDAERVGIITVAGEGVAVEFKVTQAAGSVAAPDFDPPGGGYPEDMVMVAISCTTPGAMLRYASGSGRVLGAAPTGASPTVPAAGVLQVPVPGWLQVKAWKDGMEPSAVSFAVYSVEPDLRAPEAPLPLRPIDGAGHVGLTPMLRVSRYVHPDGVAHACTRWQISKHSNFDPVLWDSGESGAAVSATTVPEGVLAHATGYYWRAGYKDLHGVWSETWTSAPSFTTMLDPLAQLATPTLSPSGGVFAASTLTVSVTCQTPDAVIRYTTGTGTVPGPDPTDSSAVVPGSGIVDIPVPGWIKVRAWSGDPEPSAVASAVFRRGHTVTVQSFPAEGVAITGLPGHGGGETAYNTLVESGTPVAFTAPESIESNDVTYEFSYWNSTAPTMLSRTWPLGWANMRITPAAPSAGAPVTLEIWGVVFPLVNPQGSTSDLIAPDQLTVYREGFRITLIASDSALPQPKFSFLLPFYLLKPWRLQTTLADLAPGIYHVEAALAGSANLDPKPIGWFVVSGDPHRTVAFEVMGDATSTAVYSQQGGEGDFEYTVHNGEVSVTGYLGDGGHVAVPGTLGGLPVTRIGEFAFMGNETLTGIAFPDSVRRIQDAAFAGCVNLRTVTFGNGLTHIGDIAFWGCEGLERLALPNNVTHIGLAAFAHCASLSQANLGSGLLSIGDFAFEHCTSLTNIVIPDSVTRMGSSVFADCTGLASATLGNGLAEIPESIFLRCRNLSNVHIPDGITQIGRTAFRECSSLAAISIPASVIHIGASAFTRCGNLQAMYFLGNAPGHGPGIFQDSNHVVVYRTPNSTGWPPAGESWAGRPVKVVSHLIGNLTVAQRRGTKLVDITFDLIGADNDTANIAIEISHGDEMVDALSFGGDVGTDVTVGLEKAIVWDAGADWNGNVATLAFTMTMDAEAVGYSAAMSLTDTRDYTLTVISEFGNPDPPVGIHAHYAWRSTITASVEAAVTVNGIEYTCNGWAGTGAVPATGVTNMASEIVLTETHSSITWEWDIAWSHPADFDYTIADGEVTIIGYTGAGGNVAIPAIIEDWPVTTIGAFAFAEIGTLKSVTIPNSVTHIGDSSFRDCSSLTSVTISDSVTTIGNSAFRGCISLTSVTIPDSVTSIGHHAFQDCSTMTNVTIPDSVTTTANFAFWGCTSLSSVTIPDSVTHIGDSSFRDCSSLTSVTIPGSVTTIGRTAFQGCTSMTSVTIPDSVTTIGGSAFRACSSLTSVTIPDSVTNIGGSAFSACSSLTSVTIPDSVTFIGAYAFKECTSLTSVTIGNGISIIPLQAFQSCSSLTSVTIPDSVTTIGESAFSYCSTLTSVTIGNSVSTILPRAFQFCSALTSVTIPDSVTSIGESAFAGCTSMTSITIGNGVMTIGNYSFRDCSSLTRVTIPDNVTSIGDCAFWYCGKLVGVYFRGDAPIHGDFIFWGTSLTVYRTAEAAHWPPVGELWVRRPTALWDGVSPMSASASALAMDTLAPNATSDPGIGPLSDTLQITTATLPAGVEMVAYSAALAAADGMPPYAWSVARGVDEAWLPNSFSPTGTLWQTGMDEVYALGLPFAFPFYGEAHSLAYVDTHGTIRFAPHESDYAPSVAKLAARCMIAPMWEDFLEYGESVELYLKTGLDAVTIQWYVRDELSISATLHRDGQIVFQYGEGNVYGGLIGLSVGDGTNLLLSAASETGDMAWADDIALTPEPSLPAGLTLSDNGILWGVPTEAGSVNVTFVVRDQDNETATRDIEVTISANANLRPVIDASLPEQSMVDVPENGSRIFSVTAQDPEADPLNYSWTLNGWQVGGNASNYLFNTDWGNAGMYVLRCYVSDELWYRMVYAEWIVTVLNDNDGDGVPNWLELDLGRAPNDPSDGGPPSTVAGTVLGSGEPLEDALLELSGASGTVYHCAVSDEQGQYAFENVPPGHYFIRVNAEWFIAQWHDGANRREQAKPFEVPADSSIDGLDFDLTGGQRPGLVHVTSEPANAQIYLDGHPVGRNTPATLDLGEVGLEDLHGNSLAPRMITVRMTGYPDPVPQQVTGEGGETQEAHFDLAAGGTGMVLIDSAPQGAEVFIDRADAPRGVTPLVVDNLAPGQHTLLLCKEGYLQPRPVLFQMPEGDRYSEESADNSYMTADEYRWQSNADQVFPLPLPFAFPFYDGSYSTIYIDTHGRIGFSPFESDWAPAEAKFSGQTMIAAMWNDFIEYGEPVDIAVREESDKVTVNWNYSDELNVSASLYSDGRIVLSYGPGNAGGGMIGISAGDGQRMLLSSNSQSGGMDNTDNLVFTPATSVFSVSVQLTPNTSGANRITADVTSEPAGMAVYVNYLPTGLETDLFIDNLDPASPGGLGWHSTAHRIMVRRDDLPATAARMVPNTANVAHNIKIDLNDLLAVRIYLLRVESNLPGWVAIDSPTGHGGTTAYEQTVGHGVAVALAAPRYLGEGDGLRRFAGWSGDEQDANRILEFTMTEDKTVVAQYTSEIDPIAANGDHYHVYRNQALDIPAPGVLANDHHPYGDPLTASLVDAPTNGTAQLSPDGSVSYTPDAGFVGDDSFTYRATDGVLVSATATVTVTVENRPPAAADVEYSVLRDQALNIPAPGVLTNDHDPDGDALTAVLILGPAHGALTLNGDGSFVYTPEAGFSGVASFTYKANDGIAESNVATVTIQVAQALWTVGLNIDNADPSTLVFGMTEDEMADFGNGLDVPAVAPDDGGFVRLIDPQFANEYLIDYRGTANEADYFLIVEAGNEDDVAVSWDTPVLPDNRYLSMWEVEVEIDGETGEIILTPIGDSAIDMAQTTELTVPVNELRVYVIRYAMNLTFDWKAIPKLTWPAPGAIVYGTPLDGTQLNAEADTPGTFAYDPPAGTVLPAGTHTLTATFTPADGVNWAAAEATVELTVHKAPLTVRADDKTRPYGQANPPLTWTATGFVAGDDAAALEGAPELACAATPDNPVADGPYPITIVQGTLAAANYAFAFIDGALTIERAALIATADNKIRAQGEPNPPLTITYTGLRNADVHPAIQPDIACAADATSPPGFYPIILMGGADPNYTLYLNDGVMLVHGDQDTAIRMTASDGARGYADLLFGESETVSTEFDPDWDAVAGDDSFASLFCPFISDPDKRHLSRDFRALPADPAGITRWRLEVGAPSLPQGRSVHPDGTATPEPQTLKTEHRTLETEHRTLNTEHSYTLTWNVDAADDGREVWLQALVDERPVGFPVDMKTVGELAGVAPGTVFEIVYGALRQFEIPLERGWNAVGTPLLGLASLGDLAAAGRGVGGIAFPAWRWGADGLERVGAEAPFLPETGYLVLCTAESASLTVTGLPPDGVFPLAAGWNLLSPVEAMVPPVVRAAGSAAWRWDGISQSHRATDAFVPGEAYWWHGGGD